MNPVQWQLGYDFYTMGVKACPNANALNYLIWGRVGKVRSNQKVVDLCNMSNFDKHSLRTIKENTILLVSELK